MKKLMKMLTVFLLMALLLAACGGQGEGDATQPKSDPESRIYYNLDKGAIRVADPYTGLYTIRLAAEGEVYEFQTVRAQILELVDGELFLGVTLDENGQVFGIKRLRDYVGGVAVENKTIASMEAGVLTLKGKGGPDSITVSEDTAVYDMTAVEGPQGIYGQLQVGDKIYALKDMQGQIIAVYVMERDRIHETSHLCDCCQQEVTWTAWDPEGELADGGHYYVNGNININKPIELKGKSVTLCLNGATAKSNGCIWVLSEGAHLKITDHADYQGTYRGYLIGGGYNPSNPAYELMNGGTIRVADETAQLSLYSGNLSVQLPTSGSRTVNYGGVIDNLGTVNLWGGAVTGGMTGHSGGNIRTCGILNIYDGAVVSNGYAPGDGGNVFADGGQLNITGGLITEGKCGDEGGNIFLWDLDVTITGGTVQKGTAVKGGNICVSGTAGKEDAENVFTMKDGTVTGGMAVCDGYPGVSYTDSNGKSSTAYPTGGNLWVNACEKIRIEGGTVSDGYADHCGGNLGATGGTLEIVGGSSVGGTAAYAGNIFLAENENSILIIRGGSILGGELDERKNPDGDAPCIRLHNKATLILSGTPTITQIDTNGAAAFDASELGSLQAPITIAVKDASQAFALADTDISASFTCENGTIRYQQGALYADVQETEAQ